MSIRENESKQPISGIFGNSIVKANCTSENKRDTITRVYRRIKNAQTTLNSSSITCEPSQTVTRKQSLNESIKEIVHKKYRKASFITPADISHISDFNIGIQTDQQISINNKNPTEIETQTQEQANRRLWIKQGRCHTINVPDSNINFEKLQKNTDTLKGMSPPPLCKAYPELIDGFSPNRITGHIPLYLMKNFVDTPQQISSPTISPRSSFRKKMKRLNVSLCENSAPKRFTSDTLIKTVKQSERAKFLSVIRSSTKPIPNKSPRNLNSDDQWIIIENIDGKRFKYNIDNLFRKYKIKRKIIDNRWEIKEVDHDILYAERAYTELLEICSLQFSTFENKFSFDKLYNENNEQITDIRQISRDVKILKIDNSDNKKRHSEIIRQKYDPLLTIDSHRSGRRYTVCMRKTSLLPKLPPLTAKLTPCISPNKSPNKSPKNRSPKNIVRTTAQTQVAMKSCYGEISKNVRKVLDEIQQKYQFDKKVYYDLFSQFMSMLNYDNGTQKIPVGTLQITIDTLKSFSNFSKEKLPEVTERLLLAADIPAVNKTLSIQEYVKVNMLLISFIANKEDYVRFWIRYFDPAGYGILRPNEHYEIIEKLSRGLFNKELTLISDSFAKNIEFKLKESGCIDELNRLNIELLEKSLNNDKFDIKILNETLKMDT